MIAALYVETGGAYYGLDGVDPWDEARDARLYPGPHPVVAHPPCSRWCRLAGLVEARWGHRRGEDGGCFAAALAAVRTWGGVLEHPAYSDAWARFDLPVPPRSGGWVRGIDGGWACHVEQSRYGHVAKKATWLYAFGAPALPSLRWGSSLDSEITALVSWCGNHVRSGEIRPRVGKAAAARTPEAFRAMLIELAASSRGESRGSPPPETADAPKDPRNLEREKGLEPSTSTLARVQPITGDDVDAEKQGDSERDGGATDDAR